MATEKQTTNLPEVYSSKEFLAKYHQTTKAPEETIECLGQFLLDAYAKQGVNEPDLCEGDPLNMLFCLEKAEHEDTTALLTVMTAIRTDGKGKIDPKLSAAFEYWGDRALAFKDPMGCLYYTFHLTMKDDDRAFAAARYARMVQDENSKSMAELLFVNLMVQYPEAYEARISALDAETSSDMVQAFLAESKEKNDPAISIFCTMLLIERGLPIDKQWLKEYCEEKNFYHLYALLTGEMISEKDYDLDYRYGECVAINEMTKACLNNDQHEYCLRLLFGYCRKYLDGIVCPMYVHAVEEVQRREDYAEKTDDLLVILQATVASAKKCMEKGIEPRAEEVEENATENYRRIVAMSLMSRFSLDSFPKLEDPVDYERLKQAIWFDGTAAKKAADLGTILEADSTNAFGLRGYLALRDGVEENGGIVYRIRVSFPYAETDGSYPGLMFGGATINGRSNLIGKGAIRSTSLDRTAITIGSSFAIDDDTYELDLTAEVDFPFPITEQFQDVELDSEEEEFVDGYCSVILTVGFYPYDEDYEGEWDDYLDDEDDDMSNGEDDYFEEEEEYDEEEEEYDAWEGVTTYDGECSVFVKFPGKTGYSYNYNGKISVGDEVKVSGKLAGRIGTVARIEAYREGDYMQNVVEIVHSETKEVAKSEERSESAVGAAPEEKRIGKDTAKASSGEESVSKANADTKPAQGKGNSTTTDEQDAGGRDDAFVPGRGGDRQRNRLQGNIYVWVHGGSDHPSQRHTDH